MGIKRWVLAISILVVVSGLLILLFVQSGADEHVIEGLLPRVEERLGVEIEYEDVEVSLTSVVFDGVQVRPRGGRNPLCTIENLGIGVRVGPLLTGDLDLTGIRMRGVELRVGESVKGASLGEWRRLADRLSREASRAGEQISEAGKRPEMQVSSGRILYDDGRFGVVVESFSARVSEGGGAVVNADGFELSHGKTVLLRGGSSEIQYRREGDRILASIDRPRFDCAATPRQFLELVRDSRESLSEMGFSQSTVSSSPADGGVVAMASADDGDEGEDSEGDGGGISLKINFADGSGSLGDSSEGNPEISLNKVSGEISASRVGAVSVRASGGTSGTDARWMVGASWPLEGDPRITLEVPDMSLSGLGNIVSDNPHIKWSNASADGVITLELRDGGKEISLEGQGALSGMEFSHPRLGTGPLVGIDAHLDFKATYDRTEAVLHLERMLISRGLARVTLRGDIDLDRLAFDISANVPPTACRQVFGAIPGELKKNLEGVRLEGKFAMDARLAVDVDNPDKTNLDVNLDNGCRITDFGTLRTPEEFKRPFAYTGYSEGGEPIRFISGPGTDRWTPFSMVSPFLIEAVLTTEDGKFRHHSGVTVPEMRRAIELNLKKDGLRHGASTITMQLAKNLFLTRERTISRKLQELFFTWYLETYFSKDEILELYFNVIEFGPSIYGIREATNHYFGREPHELNLVESVFIIKLLPNPVERHGTYVRDQVGDRKMSSLRRVMNTMRSRNRISQAELLEGLEQILEFHREGDPLPEPRIPASRDGLRVLPEVEEYDDNGVSAQPDQGWGEVVNGN